MTASNGSPLRQQPRVPAWKRLGLKLKYAKEDAGHSSRADDNHIVASRSSIGDKSDEQHFNGHSRPTKKRPTSPNHSDLPQNAVANIEAIDDSREAAHEQPWTPPDTTAPESRSQPQTEDRDDRLQSVNHSQANQKSPANEKSAESRGKSVSFTIDTKEDDGFSASAPFEKWSAEQTSGANDTTDPQSSTPSKKSRRLQKRAKNAQNSAKSASSTSQAADGQIPEYVTYLKIFHADKASWKFNKNKQNDLLKNLFDIDRIPSELNEAILQYVAGLQGTGARQRLAQCAETVIKEIAEKQDDYQAAVEMESEEARRAAYSSALRRHLERFESSKIGSNEYNDQQIEEMRREAEKGQRAEAVLGELLRKELYPDHTLAVAETSRITTPNSTANGNSKNAADGSLSTNTRISKRKRRKARTQTSADDSSSDTSASEGDFNPKRGPATIHEALGVHSDPTRSKSPPTKQPSTQWTGTKKIFDDDFLDQVFPKKQSYHETAPKRKRGEKSGARGFAYTHGTRADESGSGSEDE